MGRSRNTMLRELLAKRDMTVEKLADQIFTSRSHLTQVLLGQRPGGFTWPKLKRVLSDEEYKEAWDYAEENRQPTKKNGFITDALVNA
jgi:transcriptional regulator with XRE-family HTH domain